MSIGLAILIVAIIGFAIYSSGFRRVVLIVVGIAVVGVALLFYPSSTSDYRDCVALMWDRKHPAEVKRRQEEAWRRACEEYKLRNGFDGWGCSAQAAFPGLAPDPPPGLGPEPSTVHEGSACEHLSLEELRRADAEAGREKPPR
jgi:hypothetical protein